MMRIKINKYVACILAFAFIFLIGIQNVFAGSLGVNVYSSMDVGKTINLTITANNLTGKVNISSSNSNVISVNTTQTWVENNSVSIVLTGKSEGSATITISPTDLSDSSTGDEYNGGNIARTINVKTSSNSGNNSGGSTNGGNTATKSSNANLKSLKLNHEGLSPAFNASKTNYSLAVGPEISSINVTAVAQDSKAKVSVSGNTNLKDGDNIIYIVVTAENGGKKTYSITVTKTADANKSNAYLESMIVENATLSPAFEREVLEYDCGTVGSDIDRLTILAFPENKEAKFEITGNELIEGENIVRVKVIAVDGTTTKEYVIKVLKEKEEVISNPYVNIYEDGDNNNLTNKNTLSNIWETIKANSLLLLMYLLVIVEFIQIVYLYRKLYGKNNEHKNVGVMTKEDLVKSKIGEVKEGVGIEKTLDNTEPRKRNALNQFNVKDLTEEKKELEDTNTKSKDSEEKND